MLYCPKCQHTYETGSQRFCKNDGTRLLIAPSPGKAARQTGGVFSTLLGRNTPNAERNENTSAAPRFVQFEQNEPPEFVRPKITESFKSEPEIEAFKPEPAVEKQPVGKNVSTVETKTEEIPSGKPLARIVKPSEIPSGTASVGDRKANPTGRLALTWEQPKILLGQIVKGRYYIVEMLGEDEASISYLAEDKIVPNKKAFVRVFMDEDAEDNFSNKIFAEERVSLSHINHPNVAKVMDSGELPEGKPFIVSEYLQGKTVRDMLTRTGQFNGLRAARIIRQASYALSEAHQNGILHRNLKPENIFLTVSENGTEVVKLTNFGVLYDKFTAENLPYKSPEQIEGRLSNYASDIYSLAVIAYQMLTNRLPFNAPSANALLKAQRNGLMLLPTNFRLDVPPLLDDILEKALSYNASDRYPKARDFGDAIFNALTAASPWEKLPQEIVKEEKIEILPAEPEIKAEPEAKEEIPEPAALVSNFELEEPNFDLEESDVDLKIEPEPEVELEKPDLISEDNAIETGAEAPLLEKEKLPEIETVKAPQELPWEKRSPEPVKASGPNWLLFSIFTLGLIVFLGVWYYFLNRPVAPEFNQPSATNQNPDAPANLEIVPPQNLMPKSTEEIEIPPPPRKVDAPPNWTYFENSKQNLQGDLAKNFLGFSIYYPKDWDKFDNQTNFLDVSKNSPDGQTIKKAVITRYVSKGTFNADRALFPALRQKSDKDLASILEHYDFISESETTIQNGRWKVFEVKFQGGITKAETGEKMLVWGRRFWIPVQRPRMKSGFVITLLATSLAPDVSNVDQVAVNDDLAQILETFEPSTDN
ncbi:MAG TPA: protein kinase [Pyrinomonadaceae bacterium]